MLEGTTVSVTATPSDGYELENIYVNGTALSGTSFIVNEDKAGNGSATAPAIFNIFKDGKVTMTDRLTAPSATIGDRPVITGTYSASDGVLNLYTN